MKLTDDMREYLRAQSRTDILLYDFVTAFMQEFNLDPTAAGKLIAQWIRESC